MPIDSLGLLQLFGLSHISALFTFYRVMFERINQANPVNRVFEWFSLIVGVDTSMIFQSIHVDDQAFLEKR